MSKAKDSAADAEIIREAQDRFKLCQDWEQTARKNFLDDYKFCHGDSENGYQWPNEMLKTRNLDDRPSLTINKTRQHVLQVLNDMRQNKMQCRVSPVGDEATYESAQIMEDLIRHIEYQSQAQDVYDTAAEFQVTAGIGYWRVVTDYVSSDSFEQEIYIRRVKDPLTVLLDPDIQEKDGSDARFAFIFEDMPKDEFDKRYPKYKDQATRQPFDLSSEDWAPKDHVRIAEYYRKKEKRDRLYDLDTGLVKRSALNKDLASALDADDQIRKRDIIDEGVEWFLIIGNSIAEHREFPSKYVPIVRAIGEEIIVDGVMDRNGHVRALKDPQRMYNYWSSAAVEFVALQSKAPYVIPIESVEGVEQYWETANRVNHAYLPYKSLSDDGTPLPPPQRQSPPNPPAAFMSGMQTAAQEMMMVSGQYQSMMGEPSNERSGVAIQERQRQGDNSTYHYIDNLAMAIRLTGRILIDMIPNIYDTERAVQIVQENGDIAQISINPNMQQASAEQKAGESVMRVLNPTVGRYEVRSDVGPEFATRRQEAFNALTQLAAQAPVIMEAAPDLVMRAADFPMAEELAERLKNMVPPQAMGGPSPQTIAMQQQMANMQKVIETLTENLAEAKALTRERSQQKDIDVYKAETERMKAVAGIDPAALMPVIHQLVHEAIATHVQPILKASQESLQMSAPPGAVPGLASQ